METLSVKNFVQDLNRLLQGGVTQQELESLSGVDQVTISNLAREATKNPRVETLIKLLPFVYGSPLSPASEAPTPESRP